MRLARPLAVLLLTLTACASQPGELLNGSGDQTYGKPLKTTGSDREPNQERPKPPKQGTGGLEITVRSPSGAGLPGAKVIYAGPSKGTMVSDRQGVARATGLKVGAYRVEVAECGTLIRLVNSRASAELTIVPGRTTTGSLNSVGWEPRFQPIQQATASPEPPWQDGSEFVVSVRVNDMCSGKKAGQVAELKPWFFETTGRIVLVGAPVMRSTADGWLKARFRCDGFGEGSIILRDPRDGRRYVHVSGSIAGASEAFTDTCRQ